MFFIGISVVTLREMGMNERQIKAVVHVREKGRIANKKYQEIGRVSRQTASRELTTLTDLHILDRVGKTGQATYYKTCVHKNECLRNDSNDSKSQKMALKRGGMES